MKISEAIKNLQEVQEEQGDIDLLVVCGNSSVGEILPPDVSFNRLNEHISVWNTKKIQEQRT